MERDELGDWNQHIHTTIYKRDKDLLPHVELFSMLYNEIYIDFISVFQGFRKVKRTWF